MSLNGRAAELMTQICTHAQLDIAIDRLSARKQALYETMPKDHHWQSKIRHQEVDVPQAITDIMSRLAIVEEHPNFRLSRNILGIGHDMGRFREASHNHRGYRNGNHYNNTRHAFESVEILEEWQVLEPFSVNTQQIVRYAISHHADQSLLPLGDDSTYSDRLRYVYACLIRDADKLANWREKIATYTSTPDKVIQGQVRVLEKINPQFDGKSSMATQRVLDQFCLHQPVSVNDCDTFYDYFIQFFGWLYDMNFSATIHLTLEESLPQKMLAFLEQNIPNDQFSQIYIAVSQYLDSLHLILTG